MSDVDLIGRGWKFPIKVNAKGGLSYSDGPDRIQDAIWIVLGTAPGERVMRLDFGAGVEEFVFQSNSEVVQTQLAAAVREALVKWEPRIELVNLAVKTGSEPSLVLVTIDYRIRSTNELFNLVYPLYVQEGAG
jgi:Bacteriophage baseplate protein W